MSEEYKETEKFLEKYIKIMGIGAFQKLTIKDYHNYAKELDLLSVQSIRYITGMTWTEYKKYLIERGRENVLQKFVKIVKRKFKM